jgi:hypothetical protein
VRALAFASVGAGRGLAFAIIRQLHSFIRPRGRADLPCGVHKLAPRSPARSTELAGLDARPAAVSSCPCPCATTTSSCCCLSTFFLRFCQRCCRVLRRVRILARGSPASGPKFAHFQGTQRARGVRRRWRGRLARHLCHSTPHVRCNAGA